MPCTECTHYKELAERRGSALEAAIADLENAEVALRSERRKTTTLKGEIAKLLDDLVAKEEVQAVFDYWRRALRADSKRCVLGPKRKEKIVARIKEGYGVEDLCKAIDGARIDAYTDAKGKTHDDLELILRNEVYVERFIAAYDRHMGRVQAMIEHSMPELDDDGQIPGQTNIIDALEETRG